MINKKQAAIQSMFQRGYSVDKLGNVYNPKGRKLKPHIHKGYYSIRNRVNGETVTIKVHRLVAYSKFGDKIFEDGIHVRHLNGDSTDNSWENIGIGNGSDNRMDVPENIRQRSAATASSYRKKYNHEAIRDFHQGSYKETMQQFNIKSRAALHYILNK